MEQYLYFLVSSMLSKHDSEKIEEFNEIFADMGVSVELGKDVENTSYRELKIKYDTLKFDKFKSRNAGRPQVRTNDVLRVEDIRRRMESEPAEQIANDIGISRATLFRRLKSAEKYDRKYL